MDTAGTPTRKRQPHSHCLEPHTCIKHVGPGPWISGGFLQSGGGARRPSGLQELLRHEVKVPEGSLLASGEGTLGDWRGQGWRQAGELSLEVTKVCRATEGRHEGGLDSAGQQGLPVGGPEEWLNLNLLSILFACP